MGKITVRKILLTALLLSLVGAAVAAARGPHISNLLKRAILPELSIATGRHVTAQKIYINVFPLFIEARDLKVFDEGEQIVHIPRVKGYLGISGLLGKELVLKRLVAREPLIKGDAARFEEIIDNIKKYLEVERKAPIKVVVKTVVLDNGRFAIRYGENSVQGNGFSLDAVLDIREGPAIRGKAVQKIAFGLREFSSSIKGWPEVKGEIKGALAVRGDAVEVKSLRAGFYGSSVDATGVLSVREGVSGELDMKLGLLMKSFKKIFGLKRSGEGEVSAKGSLHLITDDILQSLLDLDLKGDIRIETLMELLKVEEKIEGRASFTGAVKGPLRKLTGNAEARLKKGNLFDVEIDDLRCGIFYKDEVLEFKNGRGSLYNGHAEAEATVSISGDEYYSLKVRYSDVDSAAAFKLIGWDPGISPGKVRGELSTAGTGFNPAGTFDYQSSVTGGDILGRVKSVKGSFVLQGDLLTLSDTAVATDKSALNIIGTVDMNASKLSLSVGARTSDVTEVTLPYSGELTGSGEFTGSVTGPSDDPLISGKALLHAASFEGYYLGEATGVVSYKKDRAVVKEFSAISGDEAIAMKGDVGFPEAKELFDLKKPHYGLSMTIKNGEVEQALKFAYKKPLKLYPKGKFDAALSITGPEPTYRGSARVSKADFDKIAIDSASLSFSYDQKELVVEEALLKKGGSMITARGSISQDERFRFKVPEGKVYLRDLPFKGIPLDANVSLKAEGKGTLEDPELELDGAIQGGRFKERDVGSGKIKASVKEGRLLLRAALFDERMALNAKASLRGTLPWTARLDLKSGRYDSLAAAFLKEIPEDLLIAMRGYADMSGDRDHFSASAVIDQLNLTLYGNSFSNDADIRFEMKDRKLALSTVKMRSGSSSFTVSGGLEIARSYDLVVEGSSALAPLKGLSKRIDVLRGDAGFVFSVAGKWENPRIDGGVTLTNAFFGLKDIPHRIGSINGYFFMDEDRIVIQKLSGKLGGGDVDISGVAYLQRFRMKRFYIDALLTNIGVNVSKDFSANVNGNILYKGTLESQTISGEIRLNRANYRERVEWKSWLLKAKAKERPRGELGPLERAVLNVKISGTENIVVDNNIARTSLKVDLLLRGTVSYPVLFGRVESKTGTVYFRNNEFRILNASADFSDPRRTNPIMEISAETYVKGYTIRLNLEGQMERFNLSLASDPPLEDIDILSLLTVGKFGKELKGIEGGIGAGEATSFLTGKFQDVAEERMRSITGLDRIEVDPYVSKTTGLVNPRVTVSKRLLGDRLFVTYSSAVGSTESDVLKLEYALGRNTSLIGIRDERGGIGGDIKFRFEFR